MPLQEPLRIGAHRQRAPLAGGQGKAAVRHHGGSGTTGGHQPSDSQAGAGDKNDFTSWQPDAVLVNLGTNDAFAFQSKAWVDEGTGETFEQKLNPDGSYEAESLARFEDAVYNFLVVLRRDNPHAHIVWLYGMIGRTMEA